MFLVLEPVQEGKCDPYLIVWHNLKMADIYHNFPIFNAAALGWLRLYPNCNLQDLEIELRNKNFQAHILATPFTKTDEKLCYLKHHFKTKGEVISPIYKATFSCRFAKYALEELLTYSTNYDENFQKLKDTGLLTVKNIDDILNNDPENRKLYQNEILPLEKITLNQFLVHFQEIT